MMSLAIIIHTTQHNETKSACATELHTYIQLWWYGRVNCHYWLFSVQVIEHCKHSHAKNHAHVPSVHIHMYNLQAVSCDTKSAQMDVTQNCCVNDCNS